MALRNEDFRKLLAETPRRTVPETPSHSEGGKAHTFTHKQNKKKYFPQNKKKHVVDKDKDKEADEEAIKLKEILKNYRDRAAERRDKGIDESEELAKLTAAYRAMPGDSRGLSDKAHARQQAIEESKFLGGDMEHTHLVKGLDYSLLHKVRSEIDKTQGHDDEGDMEKAYNKVADQPEPVEPEKPSDNRMVKNIQKTLFKEELPLRNDLFKKGRMAYVVEMEEEGAATEVPTTLLRSLIDCPNNESNSNINANNMLISKLTQVLSYLRADHKKKKKTDMAEEDIQKYQNQSIFDNEGEYVPKQEREKEKDRKESSKDEKKKNSYFDEDKDRRDRDRDRDYDRRERRNYFDDRDRDRDRRRGDDRDRREREKEREKERDRERKEREQAEKEKRLEEKMNQRKKEAEAGGYDECYPGGFAELGGAWDSDEEEDLTKMDMGNKKSGIKRWDFDNEEDYEKYQGGREAMPKAAYQFGLKSQDGRKTRKSVDNKKLDRELNQIEKINEKRKAATKDGGEYKRPKY